MGRTIDLYRIMSIDFYDYRLISSYVDRLLCLFVVGLEDFKIFVFYFLNDLHSGKKRAKSKVFDKIIQPRLNKSFFNPKTFAKSYQTFSVLIYNSA